MGMFKFLAQALVDAADGSVLRVLIVIWIAYAAVTMIECQIEKLIWGERFEHFLDPIILTLFFVFAAYSVYMCALYNRS